MEEMYTCRCCLQAAPDKDLTTPYTHLGKVEIYSLMLKECFDIHMILNDEADQGICWSCVDRLRDASDFKLLVQSSQAELLRRCGQEVITKRNHELLANQAELLEKHSHAGVATESVTHRSHAILRSQAELAQRNHAERSQAELKRSQAELAKAELAQQLQAELLVQRSQAELVQQSQELLHNQAGLQTWKNKDIEPQVPKPIKRESTEDATGDVPTLPTQDSPTATPLVKNEPLDTDGGKDDLPTCSEEEVSAEPEEEINDDDEMGGESALDEIAADPEDIHEEDETADTSMEEIPAEPEIPINRSATRDPTAERDPLIKSETDLANEDAPIESNAATFTEDAEDSPRTTAKDKVSMACIVRIKRLDEAHYGAGRAKQDGAGDNAREQIPVKLTELRMFCKICSKTFRSRIAFDNHTHSQKNKFICNLCKKSFTSKSSLIKHDCYYDSKFGHKDLSNNGTLKEHEINNTDENPHTCNVCNAKFKSLELLRKHKSVHNICKFCGKNMSTSTSLKEHERIHTGEKPHSCKYCHKKFAHALYLTQHEIIHTGEKKFECEECHQKFSRYNALKKHKITHTGDKNFGCDECGKKFTAKSSLIMHIRIHTGEKPYKCQECNIEFRYTNSLLQYKKKTRSRQYIQLRCV